MTAPRSWSVGGVRRFGDHAIRTALLHLMRESSCQPIRAADGRLTVAGREPGATAWRTAGGESGLYSKGAIGAKLWDSRFARRLNQAGLEAWPGPAAFGRVIPYDNRNDRARTRRTAMGERHKVVIV